MKHLVFFISLSLASCAFICPAQDAVDFSELVQLEQYIIDHTGVTIQELPVEYLVLLGDTNLSPQAMYEMGVFDGLVQWDRRGPGTTVLCFSLALWPSGLLLASVLSAIPPDAVKLRKGNPDGMVDANYRAGWGKGANKVRLRRIWLNFAVGLVANGVAFLIFLQ